MLAGRLRGSIHPCFGNQCLSPAIFGEGSKKERKRNGEEKKKGRRTEEAGEEGGSGRGRALGKIDAPGSLHMQKDHGC